MTDPRLEYCSACGEPTGNAGSGDGSIFWLDGAIGPLCPECNNTLRSEVLDDCCEANGVGEPSEVEGLRQACRDLLSIVADAIMHGMPITPSVADARNRAVAALAKREERA